MTAHSHEALAYEITTQRPKFTSTELSYFEYATSKGSCRRKHAIEFHPLTRKRFGTSKRMMNSTNQPANAESTGVIHDISDIPAWIRLPESASADPARLNAVRRIEPSLRHLLLHLEEPMKVPVLSAMVGLSQSSFFALFKSATGLTPLAFLIGARMQRARQLLAEPNLQVKEIAARLGYEDPFYFSRLFKSVHGVAPRDFRNRERATAINAIQQTRSHQQCAASGVEANDLDEPGSGRRISGSDPKDCTRSLKHQHGQRQSEPNQTCLAYP